MIKVMYIKMKDFTNELIRSVRDDSQQKFRNSLKENDILIIDDFQDSEGKERTQEEFYNIIEYILMEGKQVVIGCKKPPEEMYIMNERLNDLFELNEIYEITKPDLSARIEMLQRKIAAEN